jgi:uncharacterized membrane protein YeaQ/YmgE (transglycosylase-associated protein family)
MLLLAVLLLGMVAGWIANRLVGRPRPWGQLFLIGIGGSFVGGLLFSLIAGDGLALRMSGLIGSVLGALIVVVALRFFDPRTARSAR